MSESERDRPRTDSATRTPPNGAPAVDPGVLADHVSRRAPDLAHAADLAADLRAAGLHGGYDAVPARGAQDGGGAGGPPATEHEEPLEELPPRRVRIRKLRVLALLLGLAVLAAVSTVFGMMMAVTSDLPTLEEPAVRNSILTDRDGRRLGLLTGNEKRVFVKEHQIAPVMKQAIVAIEDRRFYANDGIDLRGIGRALYQDVVAQQVVQGGSTITQQFVKVSLAAQDERTLFQKLREAALAYEITRKWSKERILRNYLNTIYFGNGAYGIESAAKTYFGTNHPRCGEVGERRCAAQLMPDEAALIAALVASPTGYDPLAHPRAARQRRDLVLARMVEQGYLTPSQRSEANARPLPTRKDIQPTAEDTAQPYFTSWVKQQVVDKLGGGQTGAKRAFEGGLTVRTTIDLRLQQAAQRAIARALPFKGGPRASLVALENKSGEVLAMIGGDDYKTAPFNLATQGQRQPGSAFKPFVLAQALKSGISPSSVWPSQKQSYCMTRSRKGKCREWFEVNNYEDSYAGTSTLAHATTSSDNAVYARVGMHVGLRRIAALSRRLGIRTPVSRNAAMTLGGLEQGVTPIDMAHAYQTFARGGKLTWGTLSPGAVDEDGKLRTRVPGPVGIRMIGKRHDGRLEPVRLPSGKRAENRRRERRVLSPEIAGTVTSLLQNVVKQGTAMRAQIPGTFVAGKTGTTENYGDAWFVGWTKEITVAVWVGFPDELRPMKSEFGGEPVAGGTFPAVIFKDFVGQAMKQGWGERPSRQRDPRPPAPDAPTTPGAAATPAPAPPAGQGGAPSGQGGTGAGDDEDTAPDVQPVPPAIEQPAPQAPSPPPAAEPPPTGTTPGTGGATPPQP